MRRRSSWGSPRTACWVRELSGRRWSAAGQRLERPTGSGLLATLRAVNSPSSPPPGAPTAKTVLVVDDEKNIRRTLQLVLEGEGYQVLAVETAEEGLRLLQSPNTPVDL